MRRQHNSFPFVTGMAVFWGLNLLTIPFCDAVGKNQQMFRFSKIYEPSTVLQLADGRVLVAEDEGDRPLFISSLDSLKSGPELEPVRLQEMDSVLDDIEGSALGKDGAVYLITSHSVNKKGKRKKKREVFARLIFKDGKISDTRIFNDLIEPMIKVLESGLEKKVLKSQFLNIEGLCFDSSNKRLLFGLRSPLAGNRAIIMVLENPYALFSEKTTPRFQQKKIYLDIGGGGIRSITYDYERKVYLITNEIQDKKGKFRSVVWAWNGNPQSSPDRVVLPELKGIKNIEGMALVGFKKKTFLLMVSDDGTRKKKKGAHYYFLDTSMLIY